MSYKITKLDNFCRGITYLNDKITFVPNTLPNEEIELTITSETTKYQIGKVESFIKESSLRTKPLCPYYPECGGCDLMHTTYANTIELKTTKINEIFKNIYPNIIVVPSPKPLNYRNKITLKVQDNQVGYFSNHTHTLIPIKECLLASESINKIIPLLNELSIGNGEVTIRSNYNSEILINITSPNKLTIPDNLSSYKIVGIIQNNKIIYGEDHFIDIINHHLYEISYDSFFQINPYITSIIFNDLNDIIKDNSTILDLYCGVGTLSLAVSNKVKQLYGIEIIPNAILNAIKNAQINQVSNASYHLGEVANIITKIPEDIDTIIVDPPRKGLDQFTIKTILENPPSTLIYMSCDPQTLKRDLLKLQSKYTIQSIKAYDMFPYTYHLESVCVLNLR